MSLDIFLCHRHAYCLAAYVRPRRRPDSCIERNRIDNLISRHLFYGLLNTFLHKINGCNASCFRTAGIMFIISHDNHIICHNSLFLTVVMIGITRRNIIINGQHNAICTARYGQLTDKLNIMLSTVQADLLKVNINSIDSILHCLIDQIVNQGLPMCCGRQDAVHINAVLIFNIFNQCPHFKAHVMCLVHILLCSKADKISFIII